MVMDNKLTNRHLNRKGSFFIKRCFDFSVALMGLILLSPLFLVIAIAIKVDSKGPVLFRQKRLTKNGRVFEMYKFRSMYVDSENKGSGLFNYKDDPRVTRIGRKLRDSSLDEIPQLMNVLTGSMSIVGPRPAVVYELGDFDSLNSHFKKRFSAKAGITGLAQVMGRNDISWDEKAKWDNRYIDSFSERGIITDIEIIIKTIGKVATNKDIYENKPNDSMTAEEAAIVEEKEIIRLAHMTDEEYIEYEKNKSQCEDNAL